MAFTAWASLMCLSVPLTVSGHGYFPYLKAPGCETCSSALSYPCGHTISVHLIETALSYLSHTNDDETVAWSKISNDAMYKVDSGFYIFAYDFDGPNVAHGANSAFIGKTLPEIVEFVNNPTDGQMVDDALQAGAESAGGWAMYDWTNNPEDPPMQKIAYTKKFSKWGKDYYLGVGYNYLQEDMDMTCTTGTAAPCAEKNVLILMGDIMSKMYTASPSELSAIFAAVNAKNYTYGATFYPFIYEYSGVNVAHGARSDFVGKTLPEILDYIGNPSDGQATDDALQAGAEAGGSWVEYSWKNNVEEEPYNKIAYSMKFVNDGIEYYAGVGYNNVCGDDQYEEMATCENGPPPPSTGEGGCASYTCGMMKEEYKAHDCCGMPEKVIVKPAYRRLAAATGSAEDLSKEVRRLLEQVKAQDGDVKASTIAKSIARVAAGFVKSDSTLAV